MNKSNINNQVILIGENHYHGLGLVRCFGEMGILPICVLVGKCDIPYVEASKYWSRVHHVQTNTEAIELLMSQYSCLDSKPLVMPWSDGALLELDRNLEKLQRHFFISSINHVEGEIGKWMDKSKQVEIANLLGMKVNPSIVISLPVNDSELNMVKGSLNLPVFVKPVNSCEGSKKDMRRVDSWKELTEYCNVLAERGFKRILAQAYLQIDAEYDLMAFCSQTVNSYTLAEKIRIWPRNGGAACYAKTVNDEVWEGIADIPQKIAEFGYLGPFDIDLFKVGDQIYFNEINWRSSANVYGALASGNNYPFLWYKVLTNMEKTSQEGSECLVKSAPNIFFMNEIWDFLNVKNKYITLGEWRKDYLNATSYAYRNKLDNRPFRVRISSEIRKVLQKRQ